MVNVKNQAPEIKEEKLLKIDFLCYLFLIFIIGCFVGWVYEEAFYWITEGMLRNRGVLYGPWLPIYGIGALGIYAMKPFKKRPLALFLLCAGITGAVEYIIGIISIKFFNMRLWDYRGLFLNIRGIVCFRSVISFALLGLFFHYIVEPNAYKLFNKTSKNLIRIISLAALLILLIDMILSLFFRKPITY